MTAFRKWLVRMIGCAKLLGTSNEQSKDAYSHLAKMSELDDPYMYNDNNGGEVKPLNGQLTGWYSYKKSSQQRKKKGHETRIVLKKCDEERRIDVLAFGDRDEVYIHAARNKFAQDRKAKR